MDCDKCNNCAKTKNRTDKLRHSITRFTKIARNASLTHTILKKRLCHTLSTALQNLQEINLSLALDNALRTLQSFILLISSSFISYSVNLFYYSLLHHGDYALSL